MITLVNFIKGIFIGSAAILPGISSGVICMITGLYEKLLDSILNFFKDVRSNLKFLFPIALGSILGVILFSEIIIYCFNQIPVQIKSCFIGLLLGSLVSLIKKITIEDTSSKRFSTYLSFFICFSIGISLILMEKYIQYSTDYIANEYSTMFLVFAGFAMSLGIVIPGVSSTVILTILGVYSTYLSAISVINVSFLFPMLIGVIIGSIIFMKAIQILLENYHSQTMFGIIGFGLGSIFVLYPGYSVNLISFISIILLILGYYIGKSIK